MNASSSASIPTRPPTPQWPSAATRRSSPLSRSGRPAADAIGWSSWAEALQEAHLGHRVGRRARLSAGPTARRCRRARPRCAGDPGFEGAGAREPGSRTRTTPTMPARWPSPLCGHRGCGRCRRPITPRCCAFWPSATRTSEASAPSWCAGSMPMIASLAAGGIAKELNASDADGLLGAFEPSSAIESDPARAGPGAPRGRPTARLPAEGVPQADQDGRPGVGNLAHRCLRDRTRPGLLIDRLHRRCHSVQEPRPVRRLQRHRTDRGVLRVVV